MNARSFAAALVAAAAVVCGTAQAGGLSVTGVAGKDTLSLRAAPDAKSAQIGSLPPDTGGIAVVAVDSKGVDWVKIQKGNLSGWVNARFLRYETGAPVKMTCQGTEPFWDMTVGYGVARFEFDGKASMLALDEPQTPAARPVPWVFAVHGKPGQFLLAAEPDAKCSDGMSDNTFPYSMLVHAAGVFMEGCCK